MKKLLALFVLCTAALQAADQSLEKIFEERFNFYADEIERMERYGYHKDTPKVYYYLKGLRSAYEEAWELSAKKG